MSREEVYRMASLCGYSLAKLHGPGDERPPLNMADVLWLLGTRSATMETISECLGICSKTLQRRMREAGVLSRHEVMAWTDEELAAVILQQRLYMGFGDIGVTFTDGPRPFLALGGVMSACGYRGGDRPRHRTCPAAQAF